jgi:uncharacterized RDD family membrane protein YckC
MTFPTQQPAGWYHAQGDPPGTQRWWDGSQWVGGPVAVPPATTGIPGSGYADGLPSGWGYAAPQVGYGYVRPQYAGWWRRFGAYLLDMLIVGIPGGIINAIVGEAVPKETGVCTDFEGSTYLCDKPTGTGLAIIVLVGLALFVAGVAYYAYFHGKSGQTLGKKAVGIAVVDRQSGAPIGTGRAIGRYFATILSAMVCLLGYLWAAWDSEKQTWHDKLVRSVVVMRP